MKGQKLCGFAKPDTDFASGSSRKFDTLSQPNLPFLVSDGLIAKLGCPVDLARATIITWALHFFLPFLVARFVN
jgi:hypothetical protein